MFRLRNVFLLQPLMPSFGFAERNYDRRYNIGAFSRLREVNTDSSFSEIG